MIQSRDATMDKSEQVIMSLRETKIVHSSAQRQALNLKQRAEDVAEGIDSATEIVESPTARET